MEILELKNTVFGMKHSLDGIKRCLAITGKRIEDWSIKSSKLRHRKRKDFYKISRTRITCEIISSSLIHM